MVWKYPLERMLILLTAVGYFDKVTDLLEEIHFPEELIANTDADKFLRLIHRKGGCR